MNLINLLKSLGTYVNFVKHLTQLMKYRFANNKTKTAWLNSTKKRNPYKTIVSRSIFGNIDYQKI